MRLVCQRPLYVLVHATLFEPFGQWESSHHPDIHDSLLDPLERVSPVVGVLGLVLFDAWDGTVVRVSCFSFRRYLSICSLSCFWFWWTRGAPGAAPHRTLHIQLFYVCMYVHKYIELTVMYSYVEKVMPRIVRCFFKAVMSILGYVFTYVRVHIHGDRVLIICNQLNLLDPGIWYSIITPVGEGEREITCVSLNWKMVKVAIEQVEVLHNSQKMIRIRDLRFECFNPLSSPLTVSPTHARESGKKC